MKGGADVKLTVRTTRHGPVLSDVSADLASIAEPGKVVALAFTGLGDRDTTAEAMMRLNAARNWGEFRRRACASTRRRPRTSSMPIVAGDIGFFSPGLVPLRKSGDGLTPADGASGAFDWTGMIPFDQLPQLYNPAIGFAFNANNADVPPTISRFGHDWEENFRARRIQQFFDTIDKHSLETSAAMQADHLSLAAKDLQPFIARIKPANDWARQAQAMLMNWDGVMDKDRAEPLIFTAFLRSLHKNLLEEKTGSPMKERGRSPPQRSSLSCAIIRPGATRPALPTRIAAGPSGERSTTGSLSSSSATATT